MITNLRFKDESLILRLRLPDSLRANPRGETIILIERGGNLAAILLPGSLRKNDWPHRAVEKSTPLLEEAARQITEYLSGTRTQFRLPLAPEGTAFQQQIWTALAAIPYGVTWSYGELAARAGRKGAARAAGRALRRNPLPLVLPCHRVIGADGSLTGFGGGMWLKQALLDLEKKQADPKM